MGRFITHHGDVVAHLAEMQAAWFDACLTDPPYGLTANKKGGSGASSLNLDSPAGRSRIGTGNGGGFMGMKWDAGVPGPEVWIEVFRVLKPGAYLLAFGGTRTFHRLVCAIEDAGFELFDTACWLYGSGFPKSMDISKAIDKAAGAERDVVRVNQHGSGPHRIKLENHSKGDTGIGYMDGSGKVFNVTTPATPEAHRWNGYGTALKPAWEPIIMARKPVDRTYSNNALKHGCGGLNIDSCRIGTTKNVPASISRKVPANCYGKYAESGETSGVGGHDPNLGRWPANLILDDEAARLLDAQSGELTSGFMAAGTQRNNRMGYNGAMPPNTAGRDTYADSGGASRFFYTAKADSSERAIGGVTNTHPTVKPIDLCAWLAKLILPPERDSPRRLIVPFSGSGSEMIGALRAGWDEVTGIERESGYVAIARQRIAGDAPLLNMEAH